MIYKNSSFYVTHEIKIDILGYKRYLLRVILITNLLYTSGFTTTLVVVPGHCNFALRIFYISDANERLNQVSQGCSTIHAIFLLTVRQIRMFLSLKYFASQGESSLKI